jgi:very-short-patch-repair endonuclease
VIVADSALNRGLDQTDLCAAAARAAGWRGGTLAVRAAAFADARAQSAAESKARALFADHPELGVPDLQVRIGDADGFFAQVDFLFREHRTIVEVDGKVKYSDPWGKPGDVLRDEKLREDRLRDAGFEVVRVTWEQLVRNPGRIIERNLAAFARAARGAACAPPPPPPTHGRPRGMSSLSTSAMRAIRTFRGRGG